MNKQEPEPQAEPPYYSLDTSLFTGTFRYFDRGKSPVLVRGKIHQSDERYSLSKTERDIEPVSIPKGTRTYLQMKPYVLVPDIRLTVGLYPQPKHYADQPEAIGEVLVAHEEPKKKEIEIGQAQAWYYREDKTLTIWECFLESFVRDEDTPLSADENMRGLWTGFEHFLTRHFPQMQRIITPFDEPLFEREEYQQFLRSKGYQPVAKAAYGKEITRTS